MVTKETQTKTKSLVETLTQHVIGFSVAFSIQRFALGPLFGVEFNNEQALGITFLFVGAAMIRSYFIRRMFERFF